MALPATTVWEVRPTVGASTNGGGFVAGASGTDFSQQNSPNSGGNNGSTTDAVANGTTTLTSATASFTAAIVGNIIYLLGGSGSLAAVRRQVVSFTNGTTIVLDASVAAGTGITMNIGGALDLIATAYGSATACNTIWIKATGSNTVSATLTLNTTSGTNPTNGARLSFIGYTSTRGDNGQITWTTSTNSVNLASFTGGQGYYFANIIFSSTAGTPGSGLFIGNNQGRIASLVVTNCVFTGLLKGVDSVAFGNADEFWNPILIDTVIKSCTSVGFENASGTLINCYIHDNGSDGIKIGQGNGPSPTILIGTIVYHNTGAGLNNTAGQFGGIVVLVNSDIVGNTGDGIKLFSLYNPPVFMQNCIIDSNGGFGINSTLTTGSTGNTQAFTGVNNAFRNNTSGNYNNVTAQPTDIGLTADPFTSKTTGDFSLNSTAGGGASLKAAGFPGVLQGGGTGFLDVGAVQSQGSGGGGGTTTNYIVAKNTTQVFLEGEEYN